MKTLILKLNHDIFTQGKYINIKVISTNICIKFIYLATSSNTLGHVSEVLTFTPSLWVRMHCPFSNYHSYNIQDSLVHIHSVNTLFRSFAKIPELFSSESYQANILIDLKMEE